MKIFNSSLELGKQLKVQKAAAHSIGFVPTMGALHDGHLSLINTAVKNNDFVVVSIFVNPTQFDNHKDLDQYPKTLESDLEKIKSISSSNLAVFNPSVEEIYGTSIVSAKFNFSGLERQMEGKFRPGHFDGVGTVVQKLFNIVSPDIAYFGEKDFQQLQIIKKLVSLAKIKTEIVSCPILREPNGLAMSSRNKRLTQVEKERASKLYKTLKSVQEQFAEKNIQSIVEGVQNQFKDDDLLKLEYFQIAEESTLKPITSYDSSKQYRAFIAAHIRDVRLIDNIALN